MRTTVVPAQITTVEDKIAGRLGLSQLLLLISPVFSGSAVFVMLPPFFSYAVYKLVLIVCFAVLCGLLAIRIRGKILLFWAVILLKYNARPRYYVLNKNSTYARDIAQILPEEPAEHIEQVSLTSPKQLSHLSLAEIVKVEALLKNPAANLHFKTDKKGGLSVHITEVK